MVTKYKYPFFLNIYFALGQQITGINGLILYSSDIYRRISDNPEFI